MARVLGERYELEVELGRGAFGEVWRGKDVATLRPVAVKIVNLDELGDPAMLAETITRFRREAQTIVRLRHPNIVIALEAGRVGNELFLVMELAEGVSLSSMLRQRASAGLGLFPVASVLRIAEQVLAGLAAAHAAGVVHRDIKPSNLMVAARLQVKIIDFGIARLLADSGPRVTVQGTAIGTVAYMSPEQASGHDVDGRSDLYSFGCVLYELLAGRRPFTAATSEELLLMQVRATPVPLSSIRPGLPEGLYRLVGDLMAKDPAARPADAAQAISRVQAISAGLADTAPVHEADRETFLVRDEEAVPASLPERRPEAAGAGDFVVSADPAGDGPRFGGFSAPAPPVPAGAGGGDRMPDWPARARPARRRRRRSRWRSVLSSLITVAIVVGVGLYVWERTHASLKVETASVAAPQLPKKCNVPFYVTATIVTNGKGGSITYQWILSPGPSPGQGTVTVASGQVNKQVKLRWQIKGKGTTPASAELEVLQPEVAKSTVSFIYSCA